ncbi:putative F-box domain, leucine-rich repeat domain, L domain-containing protein [Rosa chinensis]|uniref:Putative F-box domain, leucine-rich repeat domain, L domain-containing protein n=1 Tax=Rosa chinensis TaxID=74649 RepID=A0A2P6Q636_ROSCH|nr:putative F-box/LRR-repeat protein 23 [Rosa chinensis]PRQ29624.1 putative F-box domain, leucine-rich repeat domain, L domain-containing protein [Rosa chinensis]
MGRSSYKTTQHCRKRRFSDTQEYCGEQKRACRNWLDLPEDLTASIFSRLKATEILHDCQLVCKRWLKICKVNPLVWRTIDMDHHLLDDFIYGSMEHMCRDLIDRSCGSLVDINVVRFGTDRLLKSITDSSSCGIRRLRLEDCPAITDEGLCGVASKFARLKELDISECFLSYKTLEVIGRSCPLLVSLKLKRRFNERGSNSMYGYTIARNMRGLHSLSLSKFNLTNDELRKILESCLGLETLDLGESFLPYLEEDLGRRCAEQIRKKLELPYRLNYDIEKYLSQVTNNKS